MRRTWRDFLIQDQSLLEELHLLARTYGQRPSSLVMSDRPNWSTADAARALDFDRVVFVVGMEYEARLRGGLT